MRKRFFLPVMCTVVLSGCFEKPLSQEKIEQLAAVAYVSWGTEEGNSKWGDSTIERNVLPDGLEYVSKHQRFGVSKTTVKETAGCVFRIQMWSEQKGDGMVEVVDLNKATKFEFGGTRQRNLLGGYTELEGPQVYCRADNKECEDYHIFPVLENGAKISDEDYQNVLIRRSRAVSFLRQACPGKPF